MSANGVRMACTKSSITCTNRPKAFFTDFDKKSPSLLLQREWKEMGRIDD